MNQTSSWYKGFDSLSNYSLRHEQYHFNLTEAYARLLNLYIKTNPDKNLGFYQIKMASVINELDNMQNAYDTESEHSLRFDQQAKWQYKIDSMLLVHDSNSGFITDIYSGGTIFFPFTPSLQTKILYDSPVRYFELINYGVRMSLSIHQNYKDSVSVMAKGTHKSLYKEAGIKVNSELKLGNNKVIIEISDSLGHHAYELWQYDFPNTFVASVSYSERDSLNRTGYVELAKSFVNSFKILNTDSIWLEDAKNYSLSDSSEPTKFLMKHPKSHHQKCFVRQPPVADLTFLRGPIKTPSGDLIIPHDYAERNDSVNFKQVVLIEESKTILNVLGSNNMFYIPKEKIPAKSKVAQIGFIFDSDSTKACPPVYNQSVKLLVDQ